MVDAGGSSEEETGSADTGTSSGPPADRDRAPDCPRCGLGLTRRHCKYVCPQHGVIMDCSDTFW